MCKQRCCLVGEASPSQLVTETCGAGCDSAAFLALLLTCCLWWICALGRNLGSGVSCGAGGRPRVLRTEVVWTETQTVTGCGFMSGGVPLIECGLMGVFLLNHDE